MQRRAFLAGAGASVAVLAGCSARRTGDGTTETTTDPGTATGTDTPAGTTTDSGGGTLVVATYSAFVDAPSTSPGSWLKSEFESEFDATLVYQTPENEINYYLERRNADVDIEADVYVGLNPDTLVRLDENLEADALFAAAGDVDTESVKQSLSFDPDGRAIPYDTGYISLVYNSLAGGEFEAPETFDGLLEPAYEGDLLAQNPASSATGRAFLLHTIDAKGEDGYLDYWSALQDNGVRVLGAWSDAYAAYSNEEAPMVVSYSTDQVFASRANEDLAEHQIRFLNDQGYANPEGMAAFADTDQPELAREFMSFVLRPEIQGGIAVRNVAFPATTDAQVPEDYAQYAKEPPEAVTFTYDQLKGNLSGWIEDWERQFASK